MTERTTLEIIAPTVEEALAQGLAQLGLPATEGGSKPAWTGSAAGWERLNHKNRKIPATRAAAMLIPNMILFILHLWSASISKSSCYASSGKTLCYVH